MESPGRGWSASHLLLLGWLFLAAPGCGDIPNDPNDTVESDIQGSWTVSDSVGIREIVTFYTEAAPAPAGNPIESAFSYKWQFEARAPNPFEVFYGAYSIRPNQLRVTVEYRRNSSNALERVIPTLQDVFALSVSRDTMSLNGTAYIRQ